VKKCFYLNRRNFRQNASRNRKFFYFSFLTEKPDDLFLRGGRKREDIDKIIL